MNPVLAKATPEDTRARIAETAEALFRRLGFAKTTVADIAAELGMSPANGNSWGAPIGRCRESGDSRRHCQLQSADKSLT